MMFSSRRQPQFSNRSSDTSFSSDNSYVVAVPSPPPVVLRQLVVRDLDQISFNEQERSQEREPFRIPRPILTIPRPLIRVPTNNSLWTPYARPTRVQEFTSSLQPSPSTSIQLSERPFYQIAPIPPPPPPPLPLALPAQYRIVPAPSQRPILIPVVRPGKPKKQTSSQSRKKKSPGLFSTLCAGGLGTLVALVYIGIALALPISKLVLGILYVKECPIDTNIPLYMIVSGAGGLAIILLLVFSSGCTFYRSSKSKKKTGHGIVMCLITFARGMQGGLGVFLFIWFFIGNLWIFGVRYRIQTDNPNDTKTYCHPALYWFAFYVLIFTYVYAILTCCIKCCFNFFCCGVCDVWKKAFS